MSRAAYAAGGGSSRQNGSPISSSPPGASAGRIRPTVPASPPPIQVAPMQATASNAALLDRERAGLGLLEPDPVGDPQVSGPGPRRGDVDLAEVHAQALDAVAPRPGAEHLALAAAQVEQPLVAPPPAQLPDQGQLLVGEWVEDPVFGLGYLVLAQHIHEGSLPPQGPRGPAAPRPPLFSPNALVVS